MEARTKLIMGTIIFILLVPMIGKKVLEKKLKRKVPVVDSPRTREVTQSAVSPVKPAPVSHTQTSAQTSSPAPDAPAKEAAAEVEESPQAVPMEKTELSISLLESEGNSDLCRDERAKALCQELAGRNPSFRGAKLAHNKLMIFVTGSSLYAQAQTLVTGSEAQYPDELTKWKTAGALFFRDGLGPIKGSFQEHDLMLVLLKNSGPGASGESTRAFECQRSGLNDLDGGTFSNENIRAQRFSFLNNCRFF